MLSPGRWFPVAIALNVCAHSDSRRAHDRNVLRARARGHVRGERRLDDAVYVRLCEAGIAEVEVEVVDPVVRRDPGGVELAGCRCLTARDDRRVVWPLDVSTGTGLFGNALLKEPFEWTPGYARVPERPGLGIEFNQAALAKVQIG